MIGGDCDKKVRNNPARNRGLRWQTTNVRHKHQIITDFVHTFRQWIFFAIHIMLHIHMHRFVSIVNKNEIVIISLSWEITPWALNLSPGFPEYTCSAVKMTSRTNAEKTWASANIWTSGPRDFRTRIAFRFSTSIITLRNATSVTRDHSLSRRGACDLYILFTFSESPALCRGSLALGAGLEPSQGSCLFWVLHGHERILPSCLQKW